MVSYNKIDYLCIKRITSLNPTFRGRWFHIYFVGNATKEEIIVLILLFVEDGFIYVEITSTKEGDFCLNPTFRGRWFHIFMFRIPEYWKVTS